MRGGTRGLGFGAVLLLTSASAFAAPPGRWQIGLERLFGVSHSWGAPDGGESETMTSAGVGLNYLARPGYGTLRVAADHLFESGLSLGLSLGYGAYARDNEQQEIRQHFGVFAPRAGFVLQPWAELVLWPRAGLDLLVRGRDVSSDQAAISLELPLMWLCSGTSVGLSVAPYFDLGLSLGRDAPLGLSSSGSVSEVGLSFGASLFF